MVSKRQAVLSFLVKPLEETPAAETFVVRYLDDQSVFIYSEKNMLPTIQASDAFLQMDRSLSFSEHIPYIVMPETSLMKLRFAN